MHLPSRTYESGHPENRAADSTANAEDIYRREVDHLAAQLLADRAIIAATDEPVPTIRQMSRRTADKTIAHEDDRNVEFVLAAVGLGGLTPMVLDEWLEDVGRAVLRRDVDRGSLDDAMRLLARYVLASDVQKQAEDFDVLRKALAHRDDP